MSKVAATLDHGLSHNSPQTAAQEGRKQFFWHFLGVMVWRFRGASEQKPMTLISSTENKERFFSYGWPVTAPMGCKLRTSSAGQVVRRQRSAQQPQAVAVQGLEITKHIQVWSNLHFHRSVQQNYLNASAAEKKLVTGQQKEKETQERG